jgi:hypothetical protein
LSVDIYWNRRRREIIFLTLTVSIMFSVNLELDESPTRET